jgi:ribosomal protein S18 acetylase RimI-like enzyme
MYIYQPGIMSDEDLRPSKRRKTSFSSTPSISSERTTTTESPQIAYLNELNGLPQSDFQQLYLPDHLMTFQPPKRPDTTINLTFHSSSSLPAADFRKCFELLRQTSKSHYAYSSIGWVPQRKKSEMKDKTMKYIIAHHHSTKPLSPSTDKYYDPRAQALDTFGYLSFQLTPEETTRGNTIPVLYIFEIHLGSSLRSLGLGAHLMRVAEHVANQANMRKVMLTVFTANEHAETFYRSRGYLTDESSPPALRELRRGKVVQSDYKILSLRLGVKPKRRVGVQRVRTSPIKRKADTVMDN